MSKTHLTAACHCMLQKKVRSIILLLLFSPFFSLAQPVADTLLAVRNSTLDTRLGLHVDGSFYLPGVFSGGTSYTFPVQGAGTRLQWSSDRSALRAGTIDGTQWDDANIGLHSLAIGENCRASGDWGVALGRYNTAAQQCSFAMGDQCTASGAASVALGYHAHTNARQGSFVFADRSTVDTLRAGVNHSANWRVSGGFRIFSSSNLSTGITFQSGVSVSNWGQSNAVISTSTGAMLSTSGVWQNSSDVNRKHQFTTISGEDILTRLRSIPIREWSYKVDEDDVRHIGPTAQDFYKAFHLGTDEKSIGTVDADGVALVAVQALDKRTQDQTSAINTLRKENDLLRKRLELLESNGSGSTAGIQLFALLIIAGIALGALALQFRKTKTS